MIKFSIILIAVYFFILFLGNAQAAKQLNVTIIHQFKKTDIAAQEGVLENVPFPKEGPQSYSMLGSQQPSYPDYPSVINNTKQSQDGLYWKKLSESKADELITAIESHLMKRHINVQKENSNLVIRILTDEVEFDSLKDYVFQDVDYELIEDNKVIFTGHFKQEKDCPTLTRLNYGSCKAKHIGTILAKDIVRKLKKFEKY